MNKICFGCGAHLQSENVNEIGYIPKEKLNTSVYCQRCFRLMHYGDKTNVDTPKSIDLILNNINNKDAYVLFLVDYISLNKDVIKVFKKIKTKKMLLISKADIIPKSVIYEHLINNIKKTYEINDEIKIISAESGYNVNNLINYLYYKNIKEVYLLGETNAGKSTLINKMMDLVGTNLNKITTSSMHNTTLDFIRLKLTDDLTVIDSPGFVINASSDNKCALINPKVYQMKKNETLMVGEYYFNFSENVSVIIYMNTLIDVQKVFKEVELDYEYEINNNTDLIIKGSFFINIKNKCLIKTNLEKDKLEIRESIIGDL